MAQERFWNYLDDDSTGRMNQRDLGLIPFGRYYGFGATLASGLTLNLTHTFDNVTKVNNALAVTPALGCWKSKQGVIIIEDAAITLPIAAGSSQPRIDLIVGRHKYVTTAGGSTATYSVIQGTPSATPTAPSLIIPAEQVILGTLYVPANMTNLNGAGVIYTPAKVPVFGSVKKGVSSQEPTKLTVDANGEVKWANMTPQGQLPTPYCLLNVTPAGTNNLIGIDSLSALTQDGLNSVAGGILYLKFSGNLNIDLGYFGGASGSTVKEIIAPNGYYYGNSVSCNSNTTLVVMETPDAWLIIDKIDDNNAWDTVLKQVRTAPNVFIRTQSDNYANAGTIVTQANGGSGIYTTAAMVLPDTGNSFDVTVHPFDLSGYVINNIKLTNGGAPYDAPNGTVINLRLTYSIFAIGTSEPFLFSANFGSIRTPFSQSPLYGIANSTTEVMPLSVGVSITAQVNNYNSVTLKKSNGIWYVIAHDLFEYDRVKRLKDLENTRANKTPSAWATVSSFGAGYLAGTQNPQYRKNDMGMVSLRGIVATNSSYWALNVAFTLPAGFRPTQTTNFLILSDMTFTTPVTCVIAATGDVYFFSNQNLANKTLIIDNLHFYIS